MAAWFETMGERGGAGKDPPSREQVVLEAFWKTRQTVEPTWRNIVGYYEVVRTTPWQAGRATKSVGAPRSG